MPVMEEQQLVIVSEKGSPKRARKFLESVIKKEGFSPHKYAGLEVALTEHIENIMRHAYRGKKEKIIITAAANYPEARITVLDNGPAFNMRKKKLPDLAVRIKKGLGGKMGIRTIIEMCDEVKYRRINKMNENIFIINDIKGHDNA